MTYLTEFFFFFFFFFWPICSSGSRRPNAARERSRVQSLRDGIYRFCFHHLPIGMSLRSNQDQQKSHTVICFNFFFFFLAECLWCLYCQLSNLCSRHCRPCRPVPNFPSWTSYWWPARTSPISADWSKRTTTNNRLICKPIILRTRITSLFIRSRWFSIHQCGGRYIG